MPDEASPPPDAGAGLTIAGLSGSEATFVQHPPDYVAPPRDLEARQIFDKVSARLFGGPGSTSRYEILHKLGAGGMGVVYAAEDPVLDCKVALKQLHGHLMAEPGFLERLKSEARAMARLRSEPHVVDLYDFFVQGDVVFVVMELVAGTTLRAWQAEPHAHPEVLEKYHQAGLGLAAAHRAGLIHRDFKPENVLLSHAGIAKVSDFGLAHLERSQTRTHDDLTPESTLTKPGQVVGTARYMSPEQLAGRPLDARSDQFSFCIALWEALFHNEHPFFPLPGHNPEDSGRVRDLASTLVSRGTPAPIAYAHAIVDGKLRPIPATTAVPAHVIRALTRGLRKHADERFPSMDALLAALRDAPVRRNKLRIAGVVAGLAAAVAWAIPEPPPAPPPTRAQLEQSYHSTFAADLALPTLRDHLGDAQVPGTTHILAELDRYTSRWAQQKAQHEFTLQTHPDDPNVQPRLRCLDVARKAAVTLAAGLARADAAAGPHAAELVDDLPAPEECTDFPLDYLACSLRTDDLASAPATRPVFDALQLASQQEAAGEFTDAIAQTAAAVRNARNLAVRDPLVLGHANYHHGRLLYLAGRADEAATALQTARDAVEPTGCIDLRADIYSRLIKVTAIYPSLPAAGVDEWTRIHGALARDVPDAGARIADAFNERGLFKLLRRHDPRGALDDLERAADLREWQLGGRPSMDLADTRLNMAIAHRELGSFEQAEAALAEATRLRHAVVGPEHPINYKELLERGLLQIDQGSYDEALTSLEAARKLAEAGFGRDSAPATRTTLGLAQALAGLNRPDEAIAAANDAARRAVAAAIDPSESFELRAFAASAAAEYGDPDADATLVAMAAELVPDTRVTPGSQAAFAHLLALRATDREDDSEAHRQADRMLDLLTRAGVPEDAPNYRAGLRVRGSAAYFLNDFDGAIRDLEQGLGVDVGQATAESFQEWIVFATALLDRGQQGDTIRSCEVARTLARLPGADQTAIDGKIRRICRIA